MHIPARASQAQTRQQMATLCHPLESKLREALWYLNHLPTGKLPFALTIFQGQGMSFDVVQILDIQEQPL